MTNNINLETEIENLEDIKNLKLSFTDDINKKIIDKLLKETNLGEFTINKIIEFYLLNIKNNLFKGKSIKITNLGVLVIKNPSQIKSKFKTLKKIGLYFKISPLLNNKIKNVK